MSNCCSDSRCSGCRSSRRLVAIGVLAMALGTFEADAEHLPATATTTLMAAAVALAPGATPPTPAPLPAVVTTRIVPLDLRRLDARAFGD